MRRQAARLLAYHRAPGEEGERLLAALLEDAEPSVRREAVRAAGQAKARGVVPMLLDRLGSEEDGEAGEALERFGSDLHPSLLEHLADADTPLDARRRLPRILVPGATQETVEGLVRLLPELDPGLRYEALKALDRLRRDREGLEFEEYDIEPLLEREEREAFLWAVRERGIGDGLDGGWPIGVRFLYRALAQRRWEALERASRLLGLRFSLDDLHAAFTALASSDDVTRQRGFELLESTLPLRHRERLAPLMDPDRSLDEVVEAARDRHGFDPPAIANGLGALEREDPWVAALVRAAAGPGPVDDGGDPKECGRRGRIPATALPGLESRTERPVRKDEIMNIVERAELLGRTEIFENLRTEDLAEVATLTEERTHRVGEILFEEGASGTELYVVVEGKLEAQRGDRLLFTAERSETVGDLSLLDGLPRNYRAVVVEGARLLVLPREAFYALAARRFRIARDVLTHLARVIRALNARAAEGEPLPRATVGSGSD